MIHIKITMIYNYIIIIIFLYYQMKPLFPPEFWFHSQSLPLLTCCVVVVSRLGDGPPVPLEQVGGSPVTAVQPDANRTHSAGEVMKVQNHTLRQAERESESRPGPQLHHVTSDAPTSAAVHQTTRSRTNHQTSTFVIVMDIIIRLLPV